MTFRILLSIIAVFLSFVQASSQAFTEKNPVRVALVSAVKGTGGTEPLSVGLEFSIDSGWKLYTKPPIDEEAPSFGQPPEINWSGSENLESVEILWPPGEWDGEGIYRVYVYKKSLIIPLKIKLLDEKKTLKLKGKISYFACSTTCRPFEQNIELTLTPTPALPTNEAKAIQYYEEQAEKEEFKQEMEEAASLGLMIFIALLGGLILNFMPCVLPVLSLKIIGFMKTHHPQFKNRFLATVIGILTSFWILAVVIIILKSVGITVGWGFHFQQPLFLGIMAIVMILFAFNLYGFFEIPLPSFLDSFLSTHNKGMMGEFFSGMFATLLATPCSAPFLGTAISFALSQGPFEILILFTALGVGFSSPYLLAISVPERWVKLPKPGPWMKYLQIILATSLLITGLWLTGVLGMHIYSRNLTEKMIDDNGIEWIPFDEDHLKKLIKQEKTVLVDITARWCVTCHVNKAVALNDQRVINYLKRNKVVTMRGDWTTSNKKISQYLTNHRRYSIPFNAVYSSRVPQGVVLSEILSPSEILQTLEKFG